MLLLLLLLLMMMMMMMMMICRSKTEVCQESGENVTVRSFVVLTLQQI
jgi:hypothetical protein